MDTTLVWAYLGPVPLDHVNSAAHPRNLSAWFLIQGGVRVSIGGRELEAKAGQWVLLGNGRHHQMFQKKTCILSIHFRMAWVTGQPIFPEETAVLLPGKEHRSLWKSGGELERFIGKRFNHPGVELMQTPLVLKDYLRMHVLFMRWIEAFSDAVQKAGVEMNFPRDSDERVYRALQILSSLPLHHRYNEAQVSATVGMSPSHLDRVFLTELGSTPRKVFENRRIEYVKKHLRFPNSSIKEIAIHVGFDNLGNFSKWFHRLEGMSPRSFQCGDGAQLLT